MVAFKMIALVPLVLFLQAIDIRNDNLKAVVRTDNDFVTYDDTISRKEDIPKLIQLRINKIYKVSESAINPVVFKISYNSRISIYIVREKRTNIIFYYLIAYDRLSNKVSKRFGVVNGKWMDNNEAGFKEKYKLLDSPLISFQDINGDGIKEAVIKERGHNGNMYNALISNYYSINENLDFRKILSVESKCITPLEGKIIFRQFKNNTLIATVKNDRGKDEKIGWVNLNFEKNSIVVKRKVILDEKYGGYLISSSGSSDVSFLRGEYKYVY